jgi:hypothetical protein
MTDGQWEDLLRMIGGEVLDPLPVGFLVDGPWITGITGIGLIVRDRTSLSTSCRD